MTRSLRISLAYGTLRRLDQTLQKGSPGERARALDDFRRRLRVAPGARGNLDLLDRLDRDALSNLFPFPRAAAAVLRLRTAAPEFVLLELEDQSPESWAPRILAEALGTVPPRWRSWVYRCFVHGNFSARPARDILLRHLEDPRTAVRRRAAVVLRDACVRPVPLTPDLRRLAEDDVPEVRQLAIGWMDDLSLEFVPSLIPRVHSGSAASRSRAAYVLSRHAETLAATIPHLASLKRPREFWEDPLPGLLRRLRDAEYALLPGLVRQVGSPDRQMSDRAGAALLACWRTLSRQETLLLGYLRSPLDHVRANAVKLLLLSGRPRAEIAAQLRSAIADLSPGVVLAAAEGLAHHGDLTPAERTLLARRLREWDPASATHGACLLAETGFEGQRALRALLRGLRHHELPTRLTAIRGLVMLRPVPRAAITRLLQALGDADVNVRMHALWALAPIVPRIRGDEAEIRHLIESTGGGFWRSPRLAVMRRKLRRWLPRAPRLC